MLRPSSCMTAQPSASCSTCSGSEPWTMGQYEPLTSGIWKNSGYFTSWSRVLVVPARRAEQQMAAGL